MLVNGTGGNDTLFGTSDNDTINGLDGNDVLYGVEGDDTVAGGAGSDTLSGNSGTDWLEGGTGNDELRGGSGQDSFALREMGAGNADLLYDFASGWDNLQLDAAVFTSLGAAGRFDAADDRFHAAAGATGGQDAEDRIVFNTSTGELFYDADGSGAGTAQPIATLASGRTLTASDLWVFGSPPPDGGVIRGTSGNDTLIGGDGDDTLEGLGGDDSLDGGFGADLMSGGDGNDTLDGRIHAFEDWEPDADTMDGGLGNDLFYVNNPADVLSDAGGMDTVYVIDGSWTLAEGFENLKLNNQVSEAPVDGVGNELANVLDGSVGWHVNLDGRGGDDLLLAGPKAGTLFGGDGNDTLVGGVGTAGHVFDGGEGDDLIEAGRFGERTLIGGAGNDMLEGGEEGASALEGGSGNDVFVLRAPGYGDQIADFSSAIDGLQLDAEFMPQLGASGQLSSGDARFAAGAGFDSGQDASDRVVYNTTTGDLWYDADGNGAAAAQLIATLEGAPSLVASDISIINGSSGESGMLIVGNSSSNNLVGTDGNDTLQGLGGSDTLNGGRGNDTLDGGSANDDYVLANSPGAQNADLFIGFTTGVDDLMLGNGAFTNIGATGKFGNTDARFFAGAGATSGQDASDRIIYNTTTGDLYYDADGSGAGASLLIATLQGASTLVASDIIVFSGGTTDPDEPGDGVIRGTSGNDSLVGTAGNDSMEGLAGNDTLNGGAGADTMDGGLHDDVFIVDNAGDVVVELEGGGSNDEVRSSVSYTLPAWVNNLVLTGSSVINGTGNELANIITGNAAANVLTGGEGADTVTGGGGADSIVFAAAPGTANADVVVGFVSGTDELVVDGDFHANTGASGDFAAGDARFFAGAGANSGQDASDRVVYNTTTGQLWYDADGSAAGAAQLLATLQGAPSLSATDLSVIDGSGGGDAGVHLVGTAGNDSLVGGEGNDSLEGLAGNDTLRGLDGDDTLDGGADADTLDGGLGNDVYVMTSGDTLVDAGGIDTVISSELFTALAPGFENLIVRDAGQFEVFAQGNALDNEIRHEGTGSAWINGFEGDDTLIGGEGPDFFEFANTSGSYGNDVVQGGGGTANDWMFVGVDSAATVNYHTGTVTGGGPGGSGTVQFSGIEGVVGGQFGDEMIADGAGRRFFAEGGNDTLTGGAGADELWGDGGFDHPDTAIGDDSLTGAGGDDFLRGGGGSDTLDGGAGNDTLTGSGEAEDGADRFVFSVAPGAANADLIEDFVSGVDEIVLDGDVHANTGPSGAFAAGDDRFFAGASASAGQDAEDRVVYNTTTGQLWYDADGSGAGAAQLIATLDRSPALQSTDIVIVDGSTAPPPDPGAHLVGTSSSNRLTGGPGDDTLEGLGGSDTLDGAGGNDTLSGGSANDDFNFTVAPGAANADLVTDFATGVDDIMIENGVYTTLSTGKFAGSDARFYAADGATSGQDASDRIVYDTSTGDLYYDADGSGSGEALLMATFQGAPTIVASDIIVF